MRRDPTPQERDEAQKIAAALGEPKAPEKVIALVAQAHDVWGRLQGMPLHALDAQQMAMVAMLCYVTLAFRPTDEDRAKWDRELEDASRREMRRRAAALSMNGGE